MCTFVAELSAPVGVTQTLPWLHTRPVYAPRVRLALVTERPLPAILAPMKNVIKNTHLTHERAVLSRYIPGYRLKISHE